MLGFLNEQRHKIIAILLVVVPLWMIAVAQGTEVGVESSTPTRLGGAVVGGSQAGFNGVIGAVGGVWNRIVGGELAQENEELRREVAQLREEKSRLIGVLQENSRLRELVGFKTSHPEFELAPARVVGRDVSPYFRVVKIRISSERELAPRMPVVAAEGVVGQVHRVYEGYADVVLLSDPRSRIDAISQRNRALGVVEGLGHEADYRARISYLTDRDEVGVGDTMVTSGMGEVFPAELTIGTVVEVEEGERGLFQQVQVEPAVDISRLEEVFVITNVD